MASGAAAERRFWGGLALAAVGGAVLRLWNLGGQILAGDELHAVRAALADPVGKLLTTYRQADPCLPLAALYRFLMDQGLPLSETVLRAPVVLAGLATLVLVPALVRREVGDRAALLFAWLLALSPSMVLYGRIVRPYAPVVLLAAVAVLAFHRWWCGRRRRDAAVYVLLAPLAVYFHLGAAPLVAAPIVFGVVSAARRRGSRRRWLELTAVAVAAAAVLALFLVPARDSLLALLAAKGGAGRWSASILPPVLELSAGSSHAGLAVVFWLLAAVGWALLRRRRPGFAAYTGFLLTAQVLGLWWLAPFGAFSPLIVHRYLLVAGPFVLLWVAVALAAPGGEASPAVGWRRLATPAAALFLVAGLLAGPLASRSFLHGSFVHHDDFLSFDRPPARLGDEDLPEVYRRWARTGTEDEDGALIDYPFRPSWRFARAPYVYQRYHGRRVLASTLEPPLCDPRLALTSHVCPRPASFLASSARFLVVHLDLEAEEAAVAGPRRAQDLRRPQRWQIHRQAARRMARLLRQRWGAPDLDSAGILVWDLDRVRQTRRVSSLGID